MNGSREHVTIGISAGSVARAIMVAVLFYLVYVLRDIVLVLLTAIVLASAVEPAARFGKKYRISRLVTIIGVYLIVGTLIAVMFYVFVPILIDDVNTLLTSLPQYVDSISVWNPFSDTAISGFGRAKQLAEDIALSQGVATESAGILASLGRLSAVLSQGGALQAASYFFGGFLSLALIVVLSFYLAVQENGIEKFLRLVIPKRQESYVVDLWKRSQEKIALWAQGQFVLALLVGILVFLGLTLVGVRNALLFAILAAVFEIIPLFGPIMAAIPAVAVAFIDGGVSLGLITIGLYVIIQQFENHLIYPLVVQKIVGVSPIIVILALVAGFEIAGFLGLLLSVPLATILVEILNDFEKEKAKRSASA